GLESKGNDDASRGPGDAHMAHHPVPADEMVTVTGSVAQTPRSSTSLYGSTGGEHPPEWLANLRNFYAIHNVTAWHTRLPFWVIQWDNNTALDWMELTIPRRELKPFHFEIHFGKENARDAHYLDALAVARDENQVVLRELFGFWDLFYPLPADPQRRTFLHAGQFLRVEPTWESITAQWRALTAQEPASANPDFARFVRMALNLPVLGDAALEAIEEFTELYSEFLTGGTGGTEIQQRIDELNREVFSRTWPIEDWIESTISSDKFHLTPWQAEGELTDWMQEGMGINRLPTTAMTLMPVDPRAEPLDPLRTMVRNARIQRACRAFARAMPETAATSLQDYGVSFITSTQPGKSGPHERLELRERAQRIQQHIVDNFGVRSVVGVGRTMPPGSPLHSSHREAVVALHLCVQLEKEVLFFDENYEQTQLRYADLQHAATELLESFDRQNNNEIKLASDRYVQVVLAYADERIEVVRGQFLATLFQLFAAIERRHPLRNEARDRFANDLTERLEEAHSVFQVIETFKAALQRLSFVSSKALEGPKVMRLEATLQHLRENFAEPLRLPEVARKAGFSVPAFSRVFKQATGTSFLSYLRTIRVSHAKQLLTTTPLTTEQIAQACGFQSQHHLIRSFKKVTNETPGAFRKAHATKQADDA
ncbi:MAG: AraC family transcriptional regulator, partial [Nannocystaceae bacterium]